jgi:hypothetical protein
MKGSLQNISAVVTVTQNLDMWLLNQSLRLAKIKMGLLAGKGQNVSCFNVLRVSELYLIIEYSVELLCALETCRVQTITPG